MTKKKRESRVADTGSRIIDAEDTARFKVAADAWVAANTASEDTARRKLKELGFIDSRGKPTKNYR
ncbi:MAG: hypothetical protein K8F92_07990 [Hyphomicrobium sp.]|uniref:hypothetical protein n=1 Tax=Hyphomicrobium sp. TaxID=82 RepID=UPI001323B9E8|nr:hypothetical protein [Hyphomicrobium sp.]KAB2940062.1 MAG: hypothetical protein F9K20_14510 [Hyphomicrobium sp.]MBZ0209580.1 hypothetical protein [Hyphomicrobium sp.]